MNTIFVVDLTILGAIAGLVFSVTVVFPLLSKFEALIEQADIYFWG